MPPARKSTPAPAPTSAQSPDAEVLSASVDRLTEELKTLRVVIDALREDFSWVTRNGVPVQPIEHVHVKRMALDPCADDWAERLQVERTTYGPRDAAPPPERPPPTPPSAAESPPPTGPPPGRLF